MELTLTHILIFASAFFGVLIVSLIVMGLRSLRWLQNKPRYEAAILGDDVRGRIARIAEYDDKTQQFFVQLGAERWRADCDHRFKSDMIQGSLVRVRAVNGLVLDVRPEK